MRRETQYPSWLNLEPRGSVRVFFHLKPNLIPFVARGTVALGLQGRSSCRRGWQSAFLMSLCRWLRPHAGDRNLSPPPCTSILLGSFGEGTNHLHPQFTAVNRSRCSGAGFELIPHHLSERSPGQGELGSVDTLYI